MATLPLGAKRTEIGGSQSAAISGELSSGLVRGRQDIIRCSALGQFPQLEFTIPFLNLSRKLRYILILPWYGTYDRTRVKL